jgi:predicted DNA-binding protein with PD1-like motif
MRYQLFDSRIQLRVASGEHAHDAIAEVLRSEKVGYATLTGLGAVRWVRLAYWNSATKHYEEHEVEEQLEVVSLVGNVSLRDDEPFLHWHISLGRSDLSIFGGHFLDAIVHPNLEVWLQRESEAVHRRVEATSGLALMDLPEHA